MLKSNQRPSLGKLLATLAVVATAGSASALIETNPPSGIFGGLNNLTNTSTGELAVGQDGVGFVGVEESVQSNAGAPVSLNTSMTYGSEDNGFFGVSGTGSASSFSGILRARGQIQVTENSVSNFDAPYLDPSFGDNPDGIPTSVDFTGYASFTDRLQYGGTATSYNSKYLLRLTGNISAPGGFVAIDINHGDNSQNFFFSEVGTFNEIITTETYVNGGGFQNFSITVQATASVSPEFDQDGDSVSANFSNTLEIIGLEVRDGDTDELLSTGAVTTSAGFQAPITAVPEPASAMLLATAGLLIAGRRRRRA